ncbi:MAG: LytTR family DNA-binding domain-containing protein [Lachnospiraceae bacterium]|nr:LytTR family DNA-binding domain-containing protein [Lachnospiraceae bacterium]
MYRIGICDDDKILCASLEEEINGISKELAIKTEIDVWYSGEGIQNDLQKGIELDLIFLDIELVQKNGIAVGDFIRNEMEDMQTHIVYISSKEGYAMQLFKIQPLDFLIKPVSREQLREVLSRSIRQKRSADTYFEYQKGSSVFRIPVKDIAYFMSMDKKIVIVKKDGEEIFYGKLKNIAGNLPAEFIMIHQSYIINQTYVSEYSYETVKMINGENLNISKPYRKETRSRIKQYQKANMGDDSI